MAQSFAVKHSGNVLHFWNDVAVTPCLLAGETSCMIESIKVFVCSLVQSATDAITFCNEFATSRSIRAHPLIFSRNWLCCITTAFVMSRPVTFCCPRNVFNKLNSSMSDGPVCAIGCTRDTCLSMLYASTRCLKSNNNGYGQTYEINVTMDTTCERRSLTWARDDWRHDRDE